MGEMTIQPAPIGSGIKRVVGFSGGIDSQATALWVRERFPADEIILLNSDAGGNEHPVTAEFIRSYSENVFPVTTIQALIKDLEGRGTEPGQSRDRRQEFDDNDLLTFERLAYIKGRFPSSQAQFCTEHLKLIPQRRWCQENLTDQGWDVERYVGVRRDESERRKDTPDAAWDPFFDCYVFYPVAGRTKKECFDLVISRGEAFNPLYLKGFGRVGCAPCVNSGKDDVHSWDAHYPEMIDKIRGWEAYNERTFFPPCIPSPEYNRAIKAWREQWTVEVVIKRGKKKGKTKRVPIPGAPPPPERPINWIDDVVRWARTSRGGNQFELPMLEANAAAGVCLSKYGLCE